MKKKQFDQYIYLLQGGGSLGSYQAGVYKGLHENNYDPDWVIGTSIGAVNSAILAGNKPKDRLKKLDSFWHSVSTKIKAIPESANDIVLERWQNFLSAQLTVLFGQPGLFQTRTVNPWFNIASSPSQLSYYTSDMLRENLLKHVDFNIINENKTRISVGAVHVKTGELVYFDNSKMEITVDHIMASCALPPAFPAVRIGDFYYWDGGINSNTQIDLLLKECHVPKSLCFMVNLFDSFGLQPANMDDILKRMKDIQYSSRHREFLNIYRMVHNLRHAIRILSKELPKSAKKNPELKKLISEGHAGVIHIVRFHIHGMNSDLFSKDFEFSEGSINKHFNSGYEDVKRVFVAPPWQKQANEPFEGLFVYDIPTGLDKETHLFVLKEDVCD